MKKTFKLKALVLVLVAFMALTLVPNVRANEKQDIIDAAKFTNIPEITKNDAHTNVKITATAERNGTAVETTDLQAGDIITVTFSMPKMPGYGLWDFSWKIGWLAENLDILTENIPEIDPETGKLNKFHGPDVIYFKSYPITKTIGLSDGYLGSKDNDPEVDKQGKPVYKDGQPVMKEKVHSYANGVDSVNIGTMSASGDFAFYTDYDDDRLFDLKFVVKENASGPCEVFFLKEVEEYKGPVDTVGARKSGSSYTKENGPERYKDTGRVSIFVESDLDKMEVKVPASSVKADPTAITLDLSDANNAKANLGDMIKVTPKETTDELVYTVDPDDGSIVTVKDGTVTAVAPGTATVTATCGNYHADITVTVVKSVTGIKYNDENAFTLDFQDTKDLKEGYTVEPEDAVPALDASKLTFESQDPSVASVEDGVVTGLKKGTTKVNVLYDGKKIGEVNFTVTKKVKKIELEKSEITIYKGENDIVNVKTTPEDAEFGTLNVNNEVEGNAFTAKVDKAAKTVTVTGKNAGTATVTITAEEGNTEDLKKTLTITVKENKVAEAVITADKTEMLRGETVTLTPSVKSEEEVAGVENPHKLTEDVVYTWKSSDESVATVDKNGVVTGVKEGTATITLDANGKTTTVDVTVTEKHVEGINFDEEKLAEINDGKAIETGKTLEVPFTVEPEGTTDTPEEILDQIEKYFDAETMDVKVTYENGKGKVEVTFKKPGTSYAIVSLGEIDEEYLKDIEEDLANYEEYLATGKVPESLLTDAQGNPLEGEDLEEAIEFYTDYFDKLIENLAYDGIYVFRANVADPVVEEEPAPETGDMPVALMGAIMLASVAGITVSKKILVK